MIVKPIIDERKILPLPFEPESMEAMKTRFKNSIVRTWRDSDIEGGQFPGKDRLNVFDFDDGLRIIVSREDMEGFRGIHMSGAINADGALLDEITKQAAIDGKHAFNLLIAVIMQRFHELSDGMTCVFHGVTPGKKVPHFIVNEPN